MCAGAHVYVCMHVCVQVCRCEFVCVCVCNKVCDDNINDINAQTNQTDQGLLFRHDN